MAEGTDAPLTTRAAHLCVDMQGLFTSSGPWPTPWMERVLPAIVELAARFPARTIFTRFVPPSRPEDLPGAWRRYYAKWRVATLENVDRELVNIVPSLARFSPPAAIVDKTRYSAFTSNELVALLGARQIDTLIITGSETDVCILSRS